MTTLLKECVQAKTNETRWMVGGTNHGKMAGATENGAQEAGDVPVQDVRFTGGRGHGDTSSTPLAWGRGFRVRAEGPTAPPLPQHEPPQENAADQQRQQHEGDQADDVEPRHWLPCARRPPSGIPSQARGTAVWRWLPTPWSRPAPAPARTL